MTTRRFSSASEEATEALGEALGARLPAGALVALDGDLGAGKTAFVRGLGRGLGCTDEATSPTFALLHSYGARAGGRELLHLDAWAVRRATSFLLDGGAQMLLGGEDGHAIAAVEWASRLAGLLPRPRIDIRIVHLAPTRRGIEIASILAAEGRGGAEPSADALGQALSAAIGALPAAATDLEEVP